MQLSLGSWLCRRFTLEPIDGKLPIYRDTIQEAVKDLERVSWRFTWLAWSCFLVGVIFIRPPVTTMGRLLLRWRQRRRRYASS